jgi:hypothetical protein
VLSRREPFDAGHGAQRLGLVTGGSAGHGGTYRLDVVEGRLADDFGGRRWQVAVTGGADAVRQ